MPPSNNPPSQPDERRLEVSTQASPHAPRRSRRWLVWLIVIGALLAVSVVYLTAGRPPQAARSSVVASVQTYTVKPVAFDRTIVVAGQTSARNYSSIKVPGQRGRGGGSSGMTLTKLATGGVEVKRGDVVAELDAESLIQQISDYDDTISQTEANLRRQVASQAVSWENLLQTVRSAKADRDRAVQDYKAAPVKTDIERELLNLSLEEEEASYKQQLESVPLKEISLEADTRVQEISYARQLKRGEQMRDDLKNYTYTAPMDGMVVIQAMMRDRSSDMTQYKVGDSVTPGQVFMKIVDTASMQLEAQSNQTESSELRVGQPAKVMLDAFPGMTFEGRVYSLGAIAVQGRRESYWVRTVPVVIEIKGKDPRLIPDLSGSAEVRVGHRVNVLAVPIQALYHEGDQYYVYVKGPQGFEKREVKPGMRTFLQREILSGLQAGDQVALSKPSLVQ